MEIKKREFIDFMLDCGVLKFGEFRTKSGRLSPYFINTGCYCTGSQLATLGKYYASLIMETSGGNFDALFGPAYKGIPLAAAAAMSLWRDYQVDKRYLFNRKESKDHGEGGQLVGYLPRDGDRVIIVEDVVTAGTALRETLPLLKAAANVSVTELFVSVNRMEIGKSGKSAAAEIKEEFGIHLHAIITVKDIYDYLTEQNTAESNCARSGMEDYLSRYCVL